MQLCRANPIDMLVSGQVGYECRAGAGGRLAFRVGDWVAGLDAAQICLIRVTELFQSAGESICRSGVGLTIAMQFLG